MKHEMLWVMKGVPLPKKQPAPPDWAICAIKRVAETSLKPLYEIDPGNPQNITRSNAIKMAGILQSLLFILKSPGQAAKAEEKESPEIKMLREKLSAMVPKELAGLLKKIGKASQHIKTADGSANLEQFQDDLANLMEGASSLVAPDCEFVEGRSMTAKLYLQIWVLWPELIGLKNARDFHAGLESMTTDQFSLKLVEKICTEFGVFKGRRGRPRAK